ncbi:hypothetical protein CAEBREN_09404 [Caenorhabditis brenneri]|uniref:Mos1 transposase HTH domain-containing protein n=1 Tax=Caenorhabditis brenneri TaxID=135651 RepID=G0PBL5_CAEBE|nr:hypothetical protein CAEBREN_09404 [Caenorhabditis brenneri]
MTDGVANAATFFDTGNNTRMCLLYEYLRGLTPRQALNELEKAGNKKADISEIIVWFARFRARDYSVDAEATSRPIAEEHQVTYNAALQEYKDANEEFNVKRLDTDLMDFLKMLDGLVTQKGFYVSEIEINVKNGAQPRHVLIGIEYYLEGSGATKEHHVVEIYHCGTGVVVRRGQKTKLCEGEGYFYYTMSVAVCQQVIEKLQSVVVKALTLRIDLPEDSFNLFEKLERSFATKTFAQDQPKEPTINSSASLMELARHVNGLEQLNLKYEHKLPGIDRVEKMKEASFFLNFQRFLCLFFQNFDKIFGGTRSMECTITIQVTEELVEQITREQRFRNEESHVRAMATAAEFFKDINNTRMCLLYEYLRGLSPAQTQIEMFKACGYEIKEDVIRKWFARFATDIFSVDTANKTADINEDKPEEDIPEIKEADYRGALGKFGPPGSTELDEDSKGLLNFFTDLAKLKTEEGFKVTELEISVKNDAQPKHVLIAIQYDTKAKTKEFLSAEIYHCSNGVVLRRGKQTKLLEGAQHYKYYPIALAACITLWDTLKNDKKEKEIRVDALKLSIDTNDNKPKEEETEHQEKDNKPKEKETKHQEKDNKPTKMPEYQEDHVDFFKKLMSELGIPELSNPLSDKDLIKFHSKVKVSKELNITYGKCKIEFEKDSTDEQNLQPIMEWINVFRGTFEADSKAKCVIQRTVKNVDGMQNLVKYDKRIKGWKLKVAVEKDKIIISRNRSSTSSSTSPSTKSSPKTEAPSTSQQSSSSAAPEPMNQ